VIEAPAGTYTAPEVLPWERQAANQYKNALKPGRARLGQRRAAGITRQDIEDLRDWMLTEGRRRGGKPGTGLGPRSVRLTIGPRDGKSAASRPRLPGRRCIR
jgi:hypothetical protein